MKMSIVFMFVFAWTGVLSAQFAGGNGEVGDPYQVLTLEHLAMISAYRNAHFVQIADLDFSYSPYAYGEGWVAIGASDDPFTGSYNGGGYQISNLMINRRVTNQGLFGYAENADFRNINLADVSLIMGNGCGALIGSAMYCQVMNCTVNGNIDGLDCLGTIIGAAYFCEIDKCTIDIALYGNEAVGGISGWVYDSRISNCSSHFSQSSALYGLGGIGGICFADTDITNCQFSGQLYCGGSECGGIAGEAEYTSFANCQATSGSMLTSGDAGGIVGQAIISVHIINCLSNLSIRGLSTAGGLAGWYGGYSSIDSSYSTGDVEGYYNIGGLVGALSLSSAIDCYATGNVEGDTHVGGFLGSMSESGVMVRNCYSIGAVTASDTATSGGFAGSGYPNQVFQSYWNIETSGWDTSSAGEGRSTQEMIWPYGEGTYEGWDFSAIWGHDLIGQNCGYPQLRFGVTPNLDYLEQVPPVPALLASPNPFHKELRIKLVNPGRFYDACLKIYDLRGRKITSLTIPKGCPELLWDGKDKAGKPCCSGVYILKLDTPGARGRAIKVTLVR
ncbi:MAG: T9SS type A sorting domain-containing protein [Candidatus Cloacimonetes bacterium]|nr:T9SS type A sorting domain-containing protein [Candidatus Cloacimonadota bacterium]